MVRPSSSMVTSNREWPVPVHKLEMHRVAGIFADILHVGGHQVLGVARAVQSGSPSSGRSGRPHWGGVVFRVEPHIDLAIFFLGVPGTNLGAAGISSQ